MLSDARVKEVERDFEHGSDTLRRIEPRLFRYRQNWGDHQRDGSEAVPAYAGIIAQELPDELAPFCRFASRHHAPAAPLGWCTWRRTAPPSRRRAGPSHWPRPEAAHASPSR